MATWSRSQNRCSPVCPAAQGNAAARSATCEKPYATVPPELRLVVWDDERVVWDTHGIAALLPASLPPATIRWRWTRLPRFDVAGLCRRCFRRYHHSAPGGVLTEMGWRQHLGTDLPKTLCCLRSCCCRWSPC